MATTNLVATKEGFAEVKAAKLSTLGFFMALPPVLVIILFVGLPIIVAFAFSIGYTGGPNRVISIIGQDVYSKNSWWGTADAYLAVFKDPRFLPDFALTLVVTFVSTWNEFTVALTVISSPTRQPISTGITTFIGQYDVAWEYLFTTTAIAIVPVVILFISIEKYLVGGLTAGSVK